MSFERKHYPVNVCTCKRMTDEEVRQKYLNIAILTMVSESTVQQWIDIV